MAHLVHIHGVELWRPDYYKVDNVQLDPALTPMENCWRIIDMQVSVWLNKYKMFAYSEDRMVDLEQMCRVAVYQELVRYVVEKVYNKRYNFWCNVRSCAWSVIPRTIKKWREQDIIHTNELDGNAVVNDDPASHSHETFFDMIPTESVPKLVTDGEKTYYRILDWKEGSTQAARTSLLNKHCATDYDKYLEECEELGVEPVDKVTFVCRSYTPEEQKLIKDYKPPKLYASQYKWITKKRQDPEFREKMRSYSHSYYERNKERISARKRQK